MLHAYCSRCKWHGPERTTTGPVITCPACDALVTIVAVGPTLDPLPEPEPDEPQPRAPLTDQPRLL